MDADDVETVNAHDGEPSKLSTKDKLMLIQRKLFRGRDGGDLITLGEIKEAIEHAWGNDSAAGHYFASGLRIEATSPPPCDVVQYCKTSPGGCG